ncbi:MAG: hypothetical protein GVY24_00605 [Planctomycetes bacterium]|jgi:TolB protein|nr:hypothetical protein [Planctomycetota bacterium]
MSYPKVSCALLAAAFTLGLPGCSQFYNGAVGLEPGTNNPESATKARQTRQAQANPVPMAEPDAIEVQPHKVAGHSEPRSDDAIAFEDPGRAARMTDDAVAPQYVANRADAPISALGLFGQIPVEEGEGSPMDAPGNVRRVTFTTEGADFDVAVHPGESQIVYASTRHRDTADIYLKRVDGSAVTQLTNDPANDVMPAISPDGGKVAFASDRGGTWDIYLMDIDGGQAVQVTNDRFQNLHPSFSPDGKRLVYCSFGSSSGQWELVVINVDNPAVKQLIGHGLFPEWSPKSDTIVFQRARQKGTRWFSVWTVDLADGEPTNFTEVAASANAAVITPSWDPSGDHIVFCTVLEPGADEQVRPSQADIWVVRADGSGRSRLTQGRHRNLQPTWAADGSIFFVSDRAGEGAENVWTVRPDQALHLVEGAQREGAQTAEVATEP